MTEPINRFSLMFNTHVTLPASTELSSAYIYNNIICQKILMIYYTAVKRPVWNRLYIKKNYSVLLIQLDSNLASDASTRCSGRPQDSSVWYGSHLQSIWLKCWKLSFHQVESREPNNLSSSTELNWEMSLQAVYSMCIGHYAIYDSTCTSTMCYTPVHL